MGAAYKIMQVYWVKYSCFRMPETVAEKVRRGGPWPTWYRDARTFNTRAEAEDFIEKSGPYIPGFSNAVIEGIEGTPAQGSGRRTYDHSTDACILHRNY